MAADDVYPEEKTSAVKNSEESSRGFSLASVSTGSSTHAWRR